jgi:hypothetical protein
MPWVNNALSEFNWHSSESSLMNGDSSGALEGQHEFAILF